ncbi:MAG: hypothetical protein ACR2PL_19070 [Dehalococcoidia bacterium]
MTMSQSNPDAEPFVGARVVSSDGADLGKVKEVSAPACFKVDAPLRPDYWLALDCIAESSPGSLRLNVTKANLDEAKVEAPEHSGVHPHVEGTAEPSAAAGQSDQPGTFHARPLLTAEDQAALRQRMEADLARQRELRANASGQGPAGGPASEGA